jgi:hypothetical protein
MKVRSSTLHWPLDHISNNPNSYPLLLPVIHFIQSYEAAQSELTHVLAGRDPQSPNTNNVGTHNYSKPARVVILGRGFELAQVEEVRKMCAGSAKEPVAWIVGDPAKMPSGSGPPGPGYAEIAAREVKSVLAGWRDEGCVKDGIILY